MYNSFVKFQLGYIRISGNKNNITRVDFIGEIINFDYKENEITIAAKNQIEEYLAGKRKYFNLPLEFSGTNFQEKVWEKLIDIPYGETITYKELANQVESPKGYRAVGMANNKNKIAILIPCHRVIGSNGALTGYAGGLNVKGFLLDLEKEYKE